MTELELMLKQLFVLTKEMRAAQKLYFFKREKWQMKEAMRLEMEVDRLIRDIDKETKPINTPQQP